MRNWHSVAREPPLSADSSSLSFPHCSLLTQRRLLRVGATFLVTANQHQMDNQGLGIARSAEWIAYRCDCIKRKSDGQRRCSFLFSYESTE